MTQGLGLDRRMVLRGAGVAGATVVGATALASSADAHPRHHDDVTGGWLITHKDDPPSTDQGLAAITLADGGALVSQDIAPLAPAGAGSWAPTSEGGFAFNFWTGAPSEGPGQPPVVVDVKGTGRARHDFIFGTYSFTVYDATSHLTKVLATGTGKFRGKRIRP